MSDPIPKIILPTLPLCNREWVLPKISMENLVRDLKSGRFVHRLYFHPAYPYGPQEKVFCGIETYRLGPGRVILHDTPNFRKNEKIPREHRDVVDGSTTVRYDHVQCWTCRDGLIQETFYGGPVSKLTFSTPLYLSTLYGYEASTFTFSWKEASRIARLYTTNRSAQEYIRNLDSIRTQRHEFYLRMKAIEKTLL